MEKGWAPDYARPQTPQEIAEVNERIRKFEYYGIPYNCFDEGDGEIEKLWDEASMFIMMGKDIPEDMEEKLLKFKAKASTLSDNEDKTKI